ncbi:Unknown protein, partial [Striga hermonthica]
VNMAKSTAFFSKNTPDQLINTLCHSLGGIQVHHSTKYLGLPLGLSRSKKEAFSFVVEAVRNRLNSWKNKCLAAAGKETLIKAV